MRILTLLPSAAVECITMALGKAVLVEEVFEPRQGYHHRLCNCVGRRTAPDRHKSSHNMLGGSDTWSVGGLGIAFPRSGALMRH
jgi:hypothetical protein